MTTKESAGWKIEGLRQNRTKDLTESCSRTEIVNSNLCDCPFSSEQHKQFGCFVVTPECLLQSSVMSEA